ncbi:MAG: hypothetical protein KF773_23960 [Deltaproteobacteria bacterium]|nr:hypothetical protein [Deltaproteobacteria bacterium]
MLISVERLLIKLRQPRSRADELIELRRRLRDELAADAGDDERTLAREVHARKVAVSAELREVTSCRSCATGAPWPRGHYDGGDCCAGVTADLFDDHELGALAHAGTRPRDLVPPRDDHAGCAFRGAHGCSLAVDHRPARCVHYICDTLRAELHRRGRLDAIEARLAELDAEMQRFVAVHRARRDRDVLAPILDAIAQARRG